MTVLKFIAFFFSGSGAMLSEAFHTLADTANQALIFLGIRRSEKPANQLFGYGYGAERYFYSLLSAMGIFVLGCGVTLYHGIHTLLHPPELTISWWIFAVLGISFVVDGFVFFLALKAVKAQMGGRPVGVFLESITDPTAVSVLLEDLAACFGVLFALVGIALSHWTGNPVFDSIGSILIGLMLGGIAVWIGYQNRTLILGRTIPKDVRRDVVDYLNAQATVESVSGVKSRVVGADRYKLKAEVDFDGRELGQRLGGWVEERAPELRGTEACTAFAGEFGERMMRLLGEEVDRLEGEIRELHPELEFLDFEAD